jgi:hypothetical protein
LVSGSGTELPDLGLGIADFGLPPAALPLCHPPLALLTTPGGEPIIKLVVYTFAGDCTYLSGIDSSGASYSETFQKTLFDGNAD